MPKISVRSVSIFGLLALALLPLSSCGNSSQTRSIRTSAINLNDTQDHSVLDYQLGATWDKTQVTPELLSKSNPSLQRAAKATAKVTVMFSPATGFVIGVKNGQVLMATNHHVIEDQAFCDETKVSFEILKIRGLSCDKVIATDTTLDLTLFTVKGLNSADKAKLLDVALPISKVNPKKGQNLLTVGYGFAGNDDSRLMVDQGIDCKTYSKDGDVRLLADPDTVNPGPYKTWVFATGCDVSHGDSGSALVDRTTGEVVGLLSTGKIPKIESARSPEYLKTMFDTNSDSIWSELTYVVPFAKIVESHGDALSENTSVHPK